MQFRFTHTCRNKSKIVNVRITFCYTDKKKPQIPVNKQ